LQARRSVANERVLASSAALGRERDSGIEPTTVYEAHPACPISHFSPALQLPVPTSSSPDALPALDDAGYGPNANLRLRANGQRVKPCRLSGFVRPKSNVAKSVSAQAF
ncbi:hypothetical protein THAOC_30343, partial [Thalassiosira oceanica]